MLFHGADGPAKDSDVKVGGWEPSWEWGAEDTHVNRGDEDSDMKGGAEDMKEWDTEDSDVKGGGGAEKSDVKGREDRGLWCKWLAYDVMEVALRFGILLKGVRTKKAWETLI